jgi:hypothetical protein
MNQYLVEFDMWISIAKETLTLWRQQCGVLVFADDPKQAEEIAKQVAKDEVVATDPYHQHYFHHFGNGTKVQLQEIFGFEHLHQ